MAYESLKAMIRQYIKPNDNEEITGAILQGVLLEMVQELGVAGSYLPLTGGTLTGNVMVSSNAQGDTHDAVLLTENAVTVEDVNAVGLNQSLQMTASGLIYTAGYPSQQSQQMSVAFGFTGITVSGGITATSFINSSVAEAVRGQYLLKADGNVVSIDSFASSERVATLEGYFTDGSAKSALKLTTARTLWGQPFDGTANVSGSISDATTITASGIINANGGIQIPSGRTLQIGNAVLSWDSENNAIRITTGFYSDTFISALGVGSSGGGGGVDMEQVWEALAASTNEQINATHLTTALTGYATQSWVISQGFTGSVTSITAGTGLSGGTITTSGTIAISTEYQGYISHGETAYGWGNHALAGYATQTQLNTLEYLNQATGGDGVMTLTTNKGNATVVDLTHEHSWFEIQDRPTTLKGYGISADDELLMENFLTIAFFNRLFQTHNGSADVNANDISSTIDSIEAMFGFWTEQYISALGQSSGGGGGVGDVTWELLADNTDTRQIALSHLTTALTYYATQSWVTTQIGTLEYLNQASGEGGVLSLITNKGNATLIDLTHEHSWFEIQDRPTTLVAYGVTSNDELLNTVLNTALSGYLPLTGGTITGGLTVNGGITTSGITASGNVTAAMFVRSGGTASQFLKADGSVDNTAYTTNVGTVTSVGTGTGLTGGTITVSGTISINSEYQGYISNGNTAYGWGNHATFGYATVAQLNALEFLNQVSGGDGLITLTTNKSNSTVLDLTHQHSWFEIQDRPTTILGYGITDGVFTGSVTIGSNELNTNYRLTVNGNTRTNRLYLTDSVYLEYNSTTGGVHVVGAGLYSDTFVSALGASTGTAGGVGDVTWEALASNSDSRQIAASHLSNVLSGYATTGQLSGYLPLSGGTLTGVVNFANTYGSGSIFVDTTDYDLNITAGNSIYLNANRGVGVSGKITANSFEKSGGTNTQFLKADGSVDTFTGGNGVLTLLGSGTQIDLTHRHSWFEIQDRPDTLTGYGIYSDDKVLTDALSGYATRSWVGLNYLPLSGGTITDGDYTTVINGNGLTFRYNGSGVLSCYVTNTIDGAEFYVSGVPNFNNNVFVAGGIYVTGASEFDSAVSIYATCYAEAFDNFSDLRKKDIVEYIQNLTVYNVADAPLFRYTWKNSKDKAIHIGTAAQYWQTVTPELVHVGMDTFLTMQYDVIALASAITVARTVVSHEERITILEKENEALRKEIEKLKAA